MKVFVLVAFLVSATVGLPAIQPVRVNNAAHSPTWEDASALFTKIKTSFTVTAGVLALAAPLDPKDGAAVSAAVAAAVEKANVNFGTIEDGIESQTLTAEAAQTYLTEVAQLAASKPIWDAANKWAYEGGWGGGNINLAMAALFYVKSYSEAQPLAVELVNIVAQLSNDQVRLHPTGKLDVQTSKTVQLAREGATWEDASDVFDKIQGSFRLTAGVLALAAPLDTEDGAAVSGAVTTAVQKANTNFATIEEGIAAKTLTADAAQTYLTEVGEFARRDVIWKAVEKWVAEGIWAGGDQNLLMAALFYVQSFNQAQTLAVEFVNIVAQQH